MRALVFTFEAILAVLLLLPFVYLLDFHLPDIDLFVLGRAVVSDSQATLQDTLCFPEVHYSEGVFSENVICYGG